jgi:hypothetical protein
MMKSADKTVLKRREFFKAISIGAVVASTIPLATEVRADSESNQDKRKTRYRETDEVKTFYRVNRYPNAK